MNAQPTPNAPLFRSKTITRAGILVILLGLLAIPFFSSAASFMDKPLVKREPATGRSESTQISQMTTENRQLLGLAGILPPAFLMPQGGGETITIYQGDCSTADASFDLGENVCVTITGAPVGGRVRRRLIIANPAGLVLAKVNVTTDPQSLSLTLPTTASTTYETNIVDNRGTWVVNSLSTEDGSVKTSETFVVHDPAENVASLSISKNPNADVVASGGVLGYTVLVTNSGPDAATSVELSEPVPDNTTFVSATQDSGPSFTCTQDTNNDTTCEIASLAAGGFAKFTFVFQVASGLAEGTLLTNTATVASATIERHALDNTATSVVKVSAQADTNACTLDCPADKVVTANTTQGGNPGAFVTYGAANGNGTCGAITNSIPSGSFFPVGTTEVTSSSESGQSCTFDITVVETAAPTITCPPDQQATADNTGYATVSVGNPSFTPNDGTVVGSRSDSIPAQYDEEGNLVSPGVDRPLTDPYPVGVTGITWTVTDSVGRTASCLQRITVIAEGGRPPVTISCPANVTVTAENGCEQTIPSSTIGTPTTNPSDNDVVVTSARSDGQSLSDPFPAGTTHITWTATDNQNGSVAQCTQNVTVIANDTTPPVLTVPANVSATTSSCTATLDDELGTASAEDNCTAQVNVSRTGVPANFVFPTGTTTITYTATDAAGNTATGTQTVTVTESPAIPPTVSAPADVSANTGPGATICGTVVSDATLGNASASDNCPGVTVTRTGVPAGNIFPVGNTIVTYTATDKSGNTAQDTQTVTVVDNTVPIVTAPADVTANTGPGATSCGTVVSDATLGTATASDNCPGIGAVQRTGVPAGNAFPVGNTTITYQVTDAHGNTSSDTQIVTVIDNTAPVISCPSNIVIEPTCPTGAIATYATPTATDNCGVQSVVRTAGQASGTVFPIGTTTVTHLATDIHGNTSSCSFTVTVQTPQVVVQNLIAAVNASSLTGTQKNGLLSKLNAALTAMNGGGGNACAKLSDFINSVGNLISNGSLSAATGNAWISSANHVRNTIGCTSLPCS